MTNSDYVKALVSSCERIYIDTATLMEEGMERFVFNNKELLASSSRKMIVSTDVRSELARHIKAQRAKLNSDRLPSEKVPRMSTVATDASANEGWLFDIRSAGICAFFLEMIWCNKSQKRSESFNKGVVTMDKLVENGRISVTGSTNGALSVCLDKMNGNQILGGIGIVCGTLVISVIIVCSAGYDISVDRQGLLVTKHNT